MPQLSLLHIVDGQFRTDLRCTSCDLCEAPQLKTNRMQGTGALQPKYMILGHQPGVEDDKIGRPLTGSNGRLLHELLIEAGIDTTECYLTNALKCSLFGKDPTDRHWKACQPYLLEEIRQRDPKAIIALGAQAVSWLTGQTGVKKLRKKGLPCVLNPNKIVFPLQQPATLFRIENYSERKAARDALVEDLRWIREQVESGNITRGTDIPTDYRYPTTEKECLDMLDEIEAQPLLSSDLETGSTSFEPMLFPQSYGRIISAGFSWKAGLGRAIPLYAKGVTKLQWWSDSFYHDTLLPRIKRIYETKDIFGQNFVAFDQKWIRHQFGVERCRIDFDTMLAHYLLDEERGTHNIKRMAAIYTTMPPWKDLFTLEDTDQMCQYLCRDVDAGWRLREVFEPQLTPLQTWLLKELLIPVSNVLCDVEYRGVCVSRENVERLRDELGQQIIHETQALRKIAAVKAYETVNNVEFNPHSPEQLRDLMENYLKLKCLKRTKDQHYSTDKEVLAHYADKPGIENVQKIRGLTKLRSTYCEGTLEAIKEDGRLHTSYLMTGTVTGRPASRDPNLNNIPREETAGKVLEDGKAIKSIFLPDPGDVLLQADYSQIELRVMAAESGDPEFIRIFRDGLDAHKATAAAVYGIPLEKVTGPQRSSAKTVNFGIIYGMGFESLLAKFIAAGNTEEEGRNFYNMHQRTFSAVWKWMAAQERQVRTYHYQETRFGRRRRYAEINAEALRQAYNFPIQSEAAEFTHLSLIRIWHALRQLNLPARIILTVYDSIILSVHPSAFWQVARLVKHLMESLTFDWMTVPLVVDLEAGLNWGHLRKVDLDNQKLLAK